MAIYFRGEYKKFEKQQKQQREEYLRAGMTEEQVEAMYQFDLAQLNRDLAYTRYTIPLVDEDDSDFEEEGRNSLIDKNADKLTVPFSLSEGRNLWWLDEIEDDVLFKRLSAMSAEQIQIIDQIAFRGLTQAEIAQITHRTQAAISQQLCTIRKKLKN